MPLRTFTLDSPEAYALLCQREDRPWIPNGALPREPRWGHRSDPVQVLAESESDGEQAVRSWLRHVEAGRIGGG
jgi:hypothetical protein